MCKRIQFNRKFWALASSFIVLFLYLNPEWLHMAVFIDAIGLDLFLLLVEVQIAVLAQQLYFHYLKPMAGRMAGACSWAKCHMKMALAVSAPAILMIFVVFAAIAFRMYGASANAALIS